MEQKTRGAFSGCEKHQKRTGIKWFDSFKRFDEYGFVNPGYDKIHVAMGKTAFLLIAIALIVFLLMAYHESCPPQVIY